MKIKKKNFSIQMMRIILNLRKIIDLKKKS